MAELRQVVIRPIFTERSAFVQQHQNTYVFEVGDSVNKLQVKDAIEKLFNVNVLDVRTVRVRGKIKRFGRYYGKRSNWKKAYVKLKEGDSINLRETT